MKIFAKILLGVFILFLSTPTFVGMIDDSVNTSYFYSNAEEENNFSFNEIKSIPISDFDFLNYHTFYNSISCEYVYLLGNIKNITNDIVIPPPEII